MTLTESIKSNPYLKVSNCTDLTDLNDAIRDCKALERRFGRSKMIDRIWYRLTIKKERMENERN